MNTDKIVKVYVSEESTQKLRLMKGRTGLTPNLLSRLSLALSLREPGIPDPLAYPNDGMEFNRYTLFGSHDMLITSLLRERCISDGLDPNEELGEILRAHINRGVNLLYPRLKSISDVGQLVAQIQVGQE